MAAFASSNRILMSQDKKGLLSVPKAGVTRRKSAVLESEAMPTLSPFERAYLEKLRNRERPKAVVQFSPDDEIPEDADFVFSSRSLTPREKTEETWNEEFLSRRGSSPIMDHAERVRLERDLVLPKYTSYVKNLSKNIKAFDTTYSSHKEP